MKIEECLRIGIECGLETVGESICNIEFHCANLFSISEIDKELKELYMSCDDAILNGKSPFTERSKIEDVLKYIEREERDEGNCEREFEKMPRLIDADVLLQKINGQENKGADKLMSEWYTEMVKRQPTAYEVDKVVKQLETELKTADDEKERCARENPFQFDTAKGYANGVSAALEIVKSGGIE